jgi:hypothetical protein
MNQQKPDLRTLVICIDSIVASLRDHKMLPLGSKDREQALKGLDFLLALKAEVMADEGLKGA